MNYSQIAQFYDLIHAEMTADIDLLLSLAEESSKEILELGCGTGRLAVPLARAGHKVTGIDLSDEMLDIARRKLEREPAHVRASVVLRQGDMVNIDLGRCFDLVIVSHNSLNEHTPKDVQRIFKAVGSQLSEGGLAFFDLSNPLDYFAHEDGEGVWIEDRTFIDLEGGGMLHQRSKVSLSSLEQQVRIIRKLKYVSDEESPALEYAGESTYYLLYPHEIELMLADAGMRISALFGGYRREPFEEESQRMIVVAQSSEDRSIRT
jgi:SAM-dependent methyltransferase